jgi:hypothetical protein
MTSTLTIANNRDSHRLRWNEVVETARAGVHRAGADERRALSAGGAEHQNHRGEGGIGTCVPDNRVFSRILPDETRGENEGLCTVRNLDQQAPRRASPAAHVTNSRCAARPPPPVGRHGEHAGKRGRSVPTVRLP